MRKSRIYFLRVFRRWIEKNWKMAVMRIKKQWQEFWRCGEDEGSEIRAFCEWMSSCFVGGADMTCKRKLGQLQILMMRWSKAALIWWWYGFDMMNENSELVEIYGNGCCQETEMQLYDECWYGWNLLITMNGRLQVLSLLVSPTAWSCSAVENYKISRWNKKWWWNGNAGLDVWLGYMAELNGIVVLQCVWSYRLLCVVSWTKLQLWLAGVIELQQVRIW